MTPAFVSPARALAALALLVVVAACGGATPAAESAPAAAARDTTTLDAAALRLASFELAPAESLAWREGWSIPARLTVDPTATQALGAVAEGRVKEVRVRPGDRVRRGQVLITLHSHEMNDARAELGAARARIVERDDALGLATAAAERAERLHALRALSLAELEKARSARVQAQAAREATAAELERARSYVGHLVGEGPAPRGVDDHDVLVRAPFDGVVVGRDAQPGAVVLVGAPLVTVSRLATLTLRIPVPERALGAATRGAPVRFTVAAWPGRTFQAGVTHVSPVVDSLTRTVEVLASVPAGDGVLKPEMYATAELLGGADGRTLVVPAEAVQSMEGDTVVVTARRTGPRQDALTLEAVRVRVGRRTAQHAEIAAGLEAGTLVIARGAAVARAELLKRRGGE